MLDLVTIGDIKLDTFLTLPKARVRTSPTGDELCIPFGAKIPVIATAVEIAGSAPNVAVALARMKKAAAVVSVMGNDPTAEMAKTFLKKEKVRTAYITQHAAHRSSTAAVINFQGESTQLVTHISAEYRLPTTLTPPRWIHLSELGEGYERLFADIVRYATANNVKLSYNPGQLQMNERKPALLALIAASHVVFLNLREARQLVHATLSATIRDVVTRLSRLSPATFVVTDGRNGTYAYDGVRILHCPMFPGKRIEATGAGDAFSSGYLGALLHKKSLEDALRWGSVNAASTVGHVGPTAGLLSHTEITRRLTARPSFSPRALK